MTKDEIQAVLERVRTWPPERQADLAAIALRMEEADLAEFDDLTEEDWADLEEGLAESDRGELVPEEEMKAFFAKYR